MTRAPIRLPLAFESLDEVAAAIRTGGGRLSSPRRVILEALFAADGPVSAEHICELASIPMDVSSVYRNLQHFEELGVVHHVHLAHGPGLYSLETIDQREYLVCEHCHRIDTIDSERLERVRHEILDEFGYEAQFSHFPIVGICSSCSAEKRTGTPEPARRRGRRTRTEHDHQHSHGNYVHSHPHPRGSDHDHPHDD